MPAGGEEGEVQGKLPTCQGRLLHGDYTIGSRGTQTWWLICMCYIESLFCFYVYKEWMNIGWKGMPVLPKLLVPLVNAYPFNITPGCTAPVGGELLLQDGALPPFLPTIPAQFLSKPPLMKDFRTSPPGGPKWAMNCTRPSLSKALLGRSYAGVHSSCFSLYFLLILVNRTPWVIYIPFKLIREWSQMNNYLNFLFCPEGVTQCFIYIFIYSGEDSWRKEMSGQHQGNPCLWGRVGFQHHGLWTGPFEPERHCNFLPLREFLLQSLRDLRQFCGYLYKIHW